MRWFFRFAMVVAGIAVLMFLVRWQDDGRVLAASRPEVTLDIQNATPRQVEDTTQKAVARDYAAAWQALAEALDKNRPDLLGANFVGTANDEAWRNHQRTTKERNPSALPR